MAIAAPARRDARSNARAWRSVRASSDLSNAGSGVAAPMSCGLAKIASVGKPDISEFLAACEDRLPRGRQPSFLAAFRLRQRKRGPRDSR